MKRLIDNGPDNYPGALYIVRPDGDVCVWNRHGQKSGRRGYPARVRSRETSPRWRHRAVQSSTEPSPHVNNGTSSARPALQDVQTQSYSVHAVQRRLDGDEMNLHVPQEKRRGRKLGFSCRYKTRSSHQDMVDLSLLQFVTHSLQPFC